MYVYMYAKKKQAKMGVDKRLYSRYNQVVAAELCNGSTADSDSVCLGSNPSSATKHLLTKYGRFSGFPKPAIFRFLGPVLILVLIKSRNFVFRLIRRQQHFVHSGTHVHLGYDNQRNDEYIALLHRSVRYLQKTLMSIPAPIM